MSIISSSFKKITQTLLIGLSVLFALPSLASAAISDPSSNPQFERAQTQSGTPDLVVFGIDGLPISPMSIDPTLQANLTSGTDFGTANSDQGVVRVFEVKNQGTGTLTFPVEHYVVRDPSFRTVNTLPSSLGPGESFFLEVAFRPTVRYETLSILQFRSNDPDTPTYQFAIKGYGQVPLPTILPNIDYTNTDLVGCSFSSCKFQDTSLGETREHTFTLKNYGNYDLILDELEPIKIFGQDASSQFTISQQPPAIIPALSEGYFKISFHPTVSGNHVMVFKIASNAPDSKNLFQFYIEGTGRGPHIRVEWAGTGENPADFGTAYLGFTTGSRTFVFENSNTDYYDISGITIGGKDASDFRITSPMIERVNKGDHHNFTVMFEPTTPGLKEATMTITSTALNIPVYTFPIKGFAASIALNATGNGLDIPNGSSTPNINNQTDFGNVQVAVPITRQFYMVNNGTSDLKNLTVKVSGTGFSSTQFIAPTLLQAGTSIPFNIYFTAPSTGVHTATVTIRAQWPVVREHQFVVQASGYLSPTQPDPALANIHVIGNGQTIQHEEELIWPANNTDFGSITMYGQKDHSFTIQKVGTGKLHMDPYQPIGITGPQSNSFSVTQTPWGTVTSATLTIRFRPTHSGFHEAFVIIRSSDLLHPEFRFKIQGYATSVPGSEEAEQQLFTVLGGGVKIENGQQVPSSETKTDFGSLPINQSLSHTFIISNYGANELNLTGSKIRISGAHASDFSISQAPSDSIAPSSASSFQIRFTPKANGLRSATVTIESDDPNTPSFSFVVQGTGTNEKQEQPTTQYTIALPIVRK
jgi:hypothetical protein